jgi:hypothetical protein
MGWRWGISGRTAIIRFRLKLNESGIRTMSQSKSSFRVVAKDGKLFTGHELRTLAGAVHACLRFGHGPMTEKEIIEDTKSVARECKIVDHKRRVRQHFADWARYGQDVYLKTNGRLNINPNAAYDPEWKNGTEEEAKKWYQNFSKK